MDNDKINNLPLPSSPPSRWMMVAESRAAFDLVKATFLTVKNSVASSGAEQSLPIITFPGFASDDKYMSPLRFHLKRLGYNAEGWGLGKNMAGIGLDHTLEDISDGWNVEPKDDYSPETYIGEGGVPFLCDLATKQVLKRSEELESKVILIGWSLGGYLAREVARDLPNKVAQVITFGAPVVGGPKYTTAASIFKAKGFDLEWIEREAGKRDQRPIQQPITAIFSKSDAIVDWRAAIDRFSPNVEHIEVQAAHLGMGFNTKIWQLVVDALRKHAIA